MTESEIARLERANAELQAEQDELREELGLPRWSPAEWAREAANLESEAEQYPQERADILSEAGHAWTQAGDLDRAENCYRQCAAGDDEPGMPDPRVYYATFLLEHRDESRGRELLDEIWSRRSTEPSTYHLVAEALETAGDRRQALNWVNAGLTRCYPPPFDPDVEEVVRDLMLSMLLNTRVRIRQALDQPPDSLDRLGEQARSTRRDAMDTLAERDPEPDTDRPTVLYWLAEEFDRVLRQWPGTHPRAEAAQEPHLQHRREVERSLRESAAGRNPLVLIGSVQAFEEFCAEDGLDPALASSQDEYVVEMAPYSSTVKWPPERNDPCWCSSGRKYKKCCGAPGFVD